jgi:hypothetical protein
LKSLRLLCELGVSAMRKSVYRRDAEISEIAEIAQRN